DLEVLGGPLQPVTQGMRPLVGGPGVWGGHALEVHPDFPQDALERALALPPLRAVRQRREDRQALPERGHRFMIGIPPGGIFSRLLPRVPGPPCLAPGCEVAGEVGGDVSGLGAIADFQTVPDASMQLLPPGRPELLVEGLLVQGMLKAILAPAGAIRPA